LGQLYPDMHIFHTRGAHKKVTLQGNLPGNIMKLEHTVFESLCIWVGNFWSNNWSAL